jgi:hypothetical protein
MVAAALTIVCCALFVSAAIAATPSSSAVTVIGKIGGPGQNLASVNVSFDAQTGQLSGGWSYVDFEVGGQHLTATATCLRLKVISPSVYDVVITATVTYVGKSPEHIVLEVIDNDLPGGTDAARMSYEHNGGVEQGTTPNCWVPLLSPVPISQSTIDITASSPQPTGTTSPPPSHQKPTSPAKRKKPTPSPRRQRPVAISHLKTQADGTVTFRVTVPGPGRVEALETAPGFNAATIAAVLQPAAHRFAFGRAHARAQTASTIQMRVPPSTRGELLLRNHTDRVTLRLWVTYTQAGSRSQTVVIHDLRLPCVSDPDHDADCDAPPN